MNGTSKKLTPRHRKFLKYYAQTGNHAEAYLAAGYKVKSREVARVGGYSLLRRLCETIGYRETMDNVGLDDLRLAEVLKGLVEHEDPKIQVPAVNIATKCRGWQRDTLDLGQGAQIVIVRSEKVHELEETGEAERIDDVEPKKPIALLK